MTLQKYRQEIIKKAGSWFSYGDTKLGQGRDAVKTLFQDNIELCDEIEAKIRVALSSTVAAVETPELAMAK